MEEAKVDPKEAEIERLRKELLIVAALADGSFTDEWLREPVSRTMAFKNVMGLRKALENYRQLVPIREGLREKNRRLVQENRRLRKFLAACGALPEEVLEEESHAPASP